jgi:ubiquinone/menaquinone biosynthesis C-methylase UbiE
LIKSKTNEKLMAKHVCPVWVGYLLSSPLRKLFNNPDKILGQYIKEGMTVLDVGCAMGFFSLPAARMVGTNGKVICVDIQKEMIQKLEKRVAKAGLINRVETRLCNEKSLNIDDLSEKIDFAFAIFVVHETSDASAFFSQIYRSLKPGHIFLVLEPGFHVSAEDFDKSISIAQTTGFKVSDKMKRMNSRVTVMKK